MKSSTLSSNSIIINKSPCYLLVTFWLHVTLVVLHWHLLVLLWLEPAASVGHIAEGFEDTVEDTLVYIAADSVVVAADIVALDRMVGWSLGATPPCHLLRGHIWRPRNIRA
jgi:hypothetical protein